MVVDVDARWKIAVAVAEKVVGKFALNGLMMKDERHASFSIEMMCSLHSFCCSLIFIDDIVSIEDIVGRGSEYSVAMIAPTVKPMTYLVYFCAQRRLSAFCNESQSTTLSQMISYERWKQESFL